MKASLLDIMNNGNKNDPKEDFCIVFKFSCAYMYRGVNNIVYVSRREINKDVNYIFIERGKKKKKAMYTVNSLEKLAIIPLYNDYFGTHIMHENTVDRLYTTRQI